MKALTRGVLLSFPAMAGLIACAGDAQPPADRAQATKYPGVNSVGRDRGVWQQLLTDHAGIRRSVTFTPTGVEAVTEAEDPAVVARIKDHAKAMKARVDTGARVRVWDDVFTDLFGAHEKVRLEVTETERGVRIVESSDDPEVVSLLWSHAAGVNEFVREGHRAGSRETRRIPAGSPVPPAEVAIGGVPHRLLLAQPDEATLEVLRGQGVGTVVNFRPASEQKEYDEAAAVAGAGLAYCNIGYAGANALTDGVIDESREMLRSLKESGGVAAMHCRTGNRIGPGWAAWRVLDGGVALEQAMREARMLRMTDPAMESRTRDYIRRHQDAAAGAWGVLDVASMTASQEAQRDRAVQARDRMFAQLFAALGEAMSDSGPAGAIDVCKEQAPKIALQVGEEERVLIGRSSERLRNPRNGVPRWAEGHMEANEGVFPPPRYFAAGDGTFGALLPIKLSAACVACHGEPGQIDAGVQSALAKAYPGDRATGYKEGDLRGWFWVEVPSGR